MNSFKSTDFSPQTMSKSNDWLNELRELHYMPYNSCNSLTIYSYKYWESQNRILIATKANNLKEFHFKTVVSNGDTSLENIELVNSNRSSISSNNSNPISTNFNSNRESSLNNTANMSIQDGFKSTSVVNSTVVEEKPVFGPNEIEYLEPNVKVHQLNKIKSK